MEHVGKDDPWEATVEFTAPNQLVLSATDRDPYQGKVDDSYDPHNSAYPPRMTTILQGVTFFGPLHEFYRAPDEHELRLIAEENLDGQAAYVLHLRPTGEPSPRAMERWAERLRKRATRPKHMYEFLPVEKEVDGDKQVVIELTCLYEEGPGWETILAGHEVNPLQIKWGGTVITAAIREYDGEDRPVIVLGRDPDFEGDRPITLTQFAGGRGNMTPKLTLGEGEEIFDEELLEKLKAEEPKPQPFLAMRVGCGIWRSWYGYSGGGARVDQIWVDKATGMILREEGFTEGKARFTVEYSDFEQLADGPQVPHHVVISLTGTKDYHPWVFDARFAVIDDAAWVLESLEEFQRGDELTVTAEVYDAIAERIADEEGTGDR